MVNYYVRERKGAKGITYMLDIFLHDGTRHRATFKTKELAEAEGDRIVQEKEKQAAARLLGLHLTSGNAESGVAPEIKVSAAIKKHVRIKEGEITKEDNIRAFKYIQQYIYEGLYDLDVDYIHQITLEKVQLLRAEWKKKGLQNTTVNKRIAALKTLLDQCEGWGYITRNPCARLKPLPDDSKGRKPWTDEEFSQIIKKIRGRGLDWCADILEFIDMTGARPVEAIELTDDDISFRYNTVTLTTDKGGGDSRPMPLTDRQVKFLKKVIAKRNEQFLGAKHIFVDNRGGKIYRNRISDWFAWARKECGIRRHIVPYSGRHKFITDLQEMDVAFDKIQKLAGHRRAQTTRGYSHTADSSLRNVMNLAEERRRRQG